MRIRKKRIIIFLLLLIIMVALTVLAWPKGEDSGARFRTELVARGNITQVVTANGTLNPVQLLNVGTQVSGQISKLYVQVNDEVKGGQLLAEIDPSLLLSALKQSRASGENARLSYEQAGRDLERAKTLLAKDYVAKVEVERALQAYISARNSYDSAQAQVEKDETNLSYAKITAPIDGTVISQEVTLGQTVAASFQTPNLFKIAGSLEDMKIDVNLPEADIGKVKKGMKVIFTVDAYPDREFEGVVDTVNLNPNTTQNIVTYSVVVMLENKDRVLLPGMTAYVNITLAEQPDVLRIPLTALRFTPPREQESALKRLFSVGGGSRPPRMSQSPNFGGFPGMGSMQSTNKQTIHILQNGKPEPVEVETGGADDTYIEVRSGNIKEGDLVITGLRPTRKE